MYSIFTGHTGREFHNMGHFYDIGSVTGTRGRITRRSHTIRDVWHPYSVVGTESDRHGTLTGHCRTSILFLIENRL